MIWEGKPLDVTSDFPVKIFEQYKDAFREALHNGWTSAGATIDYKSPDVMRLRVMEANVFRFACAKSDALARQLSTVARKSDTFRQFKKATDELNLVYNKRYLETEYNFAQAIGQNGSKYQNHIREKDIFPYVQYQTVGDDRVRQAHRSLDGKIFLVGSDAYDLIAPPNAWGCRCELNQMTEEDFLDHHQGTGKLLTKGKTVELLKNTPVLGGSNEYAYMVKNGFDKNRGKIGEVFDEKKDFYIQDKKTVKVKTPTVEKAIAKERRPGGEWPALEATISDKFPLNEGIFRHLPTGYKVTRIPGKGAKAGNNSYHTLHNKELNFDPGYRSQNSPYYRTRVIYHEIGHSIHYDKNIVTLYHVDEVYKKEVTAMAKAIKPRLPELYKLLNQGEYISRKNEFLAILEAKEPGKYNMHDVQEMIAAFADTVQGITRSAVGWGHKPAKMKTGSVRYREIFAHITENHFGENPVWEILDPELYKMTKKIGERIYGK